MVNGWHRVFILASIATWRRRTLVHAVTFPDTSANILLYCSTPLEQYFFSFYSKS